MDKKGQRRLYTWDKDVSIYGAMTPLYMGGGKDVSTCIWGKEVSEYGAKASLYMGERRLYIWGKDVSIYGTKTSLYMGQRGLSIMATKVHKRHTTTPSDNKRQYNSRLFIEADKSRNCDYRI